MESKQRLTFYEDFYLKSLKRLKSHPQPAFPPRPGSRGQHLSRRNKEKQNIDSSNREQQKICRPHSANGRLHTTSDDNEFVLDFQRSSTATTCNTIPAVATHCNKENNNNIYETVSKQSLNPVEDVGKYTSLPLARNSSLDNRSTAISDEHIYEVLPRVRRREENADYYCMPCKTRREQAQLSRQYESPKQATLKPASNLRSMRLMGRSMDSIKLAQGAKLRNQSTAIVPILWTENSCSPEGSSKGKYASSCTSITDSVACFGRLSHGFASLDKKNSSLQQHRASTVAERQRTISRSTCSSSSSNQSLTKRKSADDISQKSSSSSIQSAGSRCSPRPSQSTVHHTKQLQPGGGSTDKPRPYENVQFPPKHTCADYVNLTICPIRMQDELTYADLDFSDLPPSKPNAMRSSPNAAKTASKPDRQDSSGAIDIRADDSGIEYTMINITAMEAARKACAQQQLYRQRKTYTKSQSCT